jgi:hypothetical protein
MLDPDGISVTLRSIGYVLGVTLGTGAGLFTALLVRPRNAAADVAAGLVTGLLAAVVCYTAGWGWVCVLLIYRMAGERGIPYGICLGMVSALSMIGLIFVMETMAAGRLLRQHDRVRRIIGPYFELVIPTAFLIMLVGGIAFRLAFQGVGRYLGAVVVILLLALAVVSVRRQWNWRWRAILHTCWLVSLCAAFALRIRGQ